MKENTERQEVHKILDIYMINQKMDNLLDVLYEISKAVQAINRYLQNKKLRGEKVKENQKVSDMDLVTNALSELVKKQESINSQLTTPITLRILLKREAKRYKKEEK